MLRFLLLIEAIRASAPVFSPIPNPHLWSISFETFEEDFISIGMRPHVIFWIYLTGTGTGTTEVRKNHFKPPGQPAPLSKSRS